MRKLMAVLASGALVATSAQAACWTREEAAAAGVRELQSMLMVSALRCQAAGTSVMTEYNAFVTANRQAIATQNDRIRAHFIQAAGVMAGQRAYDAFTTAMANGYGAGAGAPASCAEAAGLAREAGAAGSVDGLLMLVDQLSLTPRLPDGRCEPAPLQVASAATAPIVTADTPAAEARVADFAPPPGAWGTSLAAPARYAAADYRAAWSAPRFDPQASPTGFGGAAGPEER